MLYDDNAINQAYDLLKKANTYLQIASDYCGYNNVLSGNNLVKSCEKIIDECEVAIRKTEKLFDFTNLDSNNQTLNLNNFVSSNNDLEEIIDFSLYTKEEQEDIKEFIANNNTEGLITYIIRKSALEEREKLQKELDDIQKKLDENFNYEVAKAWGVSTLTKLTDEERKKLEQTKNELSLKISQIDEELYRYNLSIELSKYNCYYEYSNNYKVKMDSSIENTLYTFVSGMGSLTEGIKSLKRENIEFDYIELLMYLYENPNELEKYLSLTGEEVLIDDKIDKDLFIKLIEEKNILDLDSIVNSGSANFYNAFKYLSIEDLKLYCYLKEEKGNAVANNFLALKQDEINSKVGLAKAMEDFEWIANGGSITTVLKSYGVGIKDGVIQWGDNAIAFFSTSSTLSSNQYAISYLTSMLEGAYAFFEIDLDSLNEMKDSLDEDTYNSLKDSLENDCKITNLDLYYLTNQIDEDTYNNIKEITSTDEYQEYFNNKSESLKYAAKIAFQTGVSTGNMLPSVLIGMLAQGMYLPVGISSNLSKIAMFLSAAGGSKKEALSQGNTLARATIYGLLSGASEVTTEVLLGGIPGISQSKSWNIFNGSIKDSKVKTLLKILGRSLIEEPIKEMSEEAVQLPIGTLIESIALGKKIKLDESSAEWLEQLPETLLVAYFSSFGLNATSQTMNFIVNGKDITISSKQIESYFDENGEFNQIKYNQDIMNLFNSALENNSTSTSTNTNNSNNTSGVRENNVNINQLNTITLKLKKVFKSNPLYLNFLLRNMKSNNVDNNNQMILGFDEKVWNKKNIELLSRKITDGAITAIPTIDVLMHDKKIFGDLIRYQPDFVKDNLYSFPIDMWSCSDYIKFHHDENNSITIPKDFIRTAFIEYAIEQGIYPVGLRKSDIDILDLTDSEKIKLIDMIDKMDFILDEWKTDKTVLDKILQSQDSKTIDLISMFEQNFLEKNIESIMVSLVSNKSVLSNLSYETREFLLNLLVRELSYSNVYYSQDEFNYYKNFLDNFSNSDVENYVSKNIDFIFERKLLSIIPDNILNNHIDEIYNKIKGDYEIIKSSKLKFNQQLLIKYLQQDDYLTYWVIPVFDLSLFTDEIIDKYSDVILNCYISLPKSSSFSEKMSNSSLLLEKCLQLGNLTAVAYFNSDLFTDEIIDKYSDVILNGYESLPKSSPAFEKMSNSSLLLEKFLQLGNVDAIAYFNSDLFTDEIINKYSDVILNSYESLPKSSPAFEKMSNSSLLLEKFLQLGNMDAIAGFNSDLFTDEIIDKYSDVILNGYESLSQFEGVYNKLRNSLVLFEKCLQLGNMDAVAHFDFNSDLFTIETIGKYIDKYIDIIIKNYNSELIYAKNNSLYILIYEEIYTKFSRTGNSSLLFEKCLQLDNIDLLIDYQLSPSLFTENIIEKYGNKFIDYISINGIPDCLSKNQYLFKKCLNSSRDDLLKLFAPSLVISSMNELIKLNKTELISSTLKECFDNFDLNLLLQVDDNILKMFFSPKQASMIRIGQNLNEDARKKYEFAVKNQLKKGFDIEKISFENIEKMPLLSTRIAFSNSSELARIGTQLFEQLLLVNNSELVIDDVEKIFLRKDIPIVGKLYLTWEKLHPDFSGYILKNPALSPTLLSFFETGNLTGAQKVIFSDLLLSALGSNNRSLIEYINDIELGNEIFENLQSGNIKIEKLNDKQQEVLKTFIYHLNALYNNSDSVRNSYADKNVLTGDLETDLSRLSILFRINRELGENIPDKIVQMFAHDAGFDTITSLKEYMVKKVEEANTRNFRRAHEGTLTLEVGDLVKGLGKNLFDLTIFENILQNGSIAADYLGAASHTDATPLDTDLCKIFEKKDSIGATIRNTVSHAYGSLYAILKNDGRFQETRKSKFESDQELTKDVDLRKIESFQTGRLADNHYGIRTGFASSEIDFLVCEEYSPQIGFELARNGIYIPVVDYNGNLVFTPEDYMALRNKMSGLSHYNTGSYQFSPKLVPSEEISLAQKANREEVKTKQFAILKHFANAISSLGLNIKMAIDGDLVPGTIEIIDTGSTGRYTNKPHDADFDYMLRVDKLIRENKSEFMALSKVLNEALSDRDDTSFTTGNGDFRFKGVKIPGLEERVDIDITFTDRTDRIKYSSDMSLKDRLNTIKEQDPSRYDVVVNEIINAKKILKAGRCYKPVHSNAGQDGLGGVGVENWILQFGGSLEDAARNFIEVANSCSSFAEFCKKYQVWDFGENFVSKPKKDKITYLHDEFVSNNMSSDGYLKMQKVLSIYLKYVDMNVSNPIELTLEELNANEK